MRILLSAVGITWVWLFTVSHFGLQGIRILLPHIFHWSHRVSFKVTPPQILPRQAAASCSLLPMLPFNSLLASVLCTSPTPLFNYRQENLFPCFTSSLQEHLDTCSDLQLIMDLSTANKSPSTQLHYCTYMDAAPVICTLELPLCASY